MRRASRWEARWLRIVCGCVLVTAGGWGMLRSARAAFAQRIYKGVKHGFFVGTRLERPPVRDPLEVLRQCERAHAWYPYNYYFPTLASIRSLDGALRADTYETFLRLFRAAGYWNEVSIALNPYAIEAMHVKCRLLRESGDLAGAIEFWRGVVMEREFWNPDHHATLVELLLLADRREEAIAAGRWLRGGELHTRLRDLEREMARTAPRNGG